MATADNGVIDLRAHTITYTALPFPLPKAWRDEFIKQGKNRGDFAGLNALEQRCRAAIGFEVTRKYIPTHQGKDPRVASKA